MFALDLHYIVEHYEDRKLVLYVALLTCFANLKDGSKQHIFVILVGRGQNDDEIRRDAWTLKKKDLLKQLVPRLVFILFLMVCLSLKYYMNFVFPNTAVPFANRIEAIELSRWYSWGFLCVNPLHMSQHCFLSPLPHLNNQQQPRTLRYMWFEPMPSIEKHLQVCRYGDMDFTIHECLSQILVTKHHI